MDTTSDHALTIKHAVVRVRVKPIDTNFEVEEELIRWIRELHSFMHCAVRVKNTFIIRRPFSPTTVDILIVIVKKKYI